MHQSPNKLSKFWQELKRRNVVHVITVYAGAAFVIIELVDILAPSLGFPQRTLHFVLILLIVGFIITVIVSWIYDIHPEEGIVKTEPADKAGAGEPPGSSNSWKIASYVSFVVILVMGGFLIYPKIFKPDNLRKLRNDEGVISLAVFPFDNLTGDSSLYYWQNGISEYLINRLGNSREVDVSSSQVVSDVLEVTRQVSTASISPDIARKTAIKIDASTYITGNFIGKENDASIMLNLVNTESGELIWTTSVDGDLEGNYRAVLEHLSDTIRNYIEIKALEQSAEADLTNAFPNSAESYRHYIDGLKAFVDMDYESAIESLNTAYELDTTFTFAAFYLAFAHNMRNANDKSCVRWVKRAHRLKDNLPKSYRPWIELWYALFITKNSDQIRRCADKMYDEAFNNRFLWFDVATIYASWLHDYPKAINAYERVEALNRQWDDDWEYDMYYRFYARDLLLADRPDEAIRIANIGLKVNPSHGWMVLFIGAADIMRGDSISAQIHEKEAWKILEEYNMPEVVSNVYIGEMHCMGKDTIGAIGYFKRAYEMNSEWLGSLQMLIECQLRTDMNLEECYRLSEYGLKHQPDSSDLLWLKGLSLHKLGKHQEALKILKEVEDQFFQYNYKLYRDIQKVERSVEHDRSS